MRDPKVKNKYGIRPKDICNATIVDRNRLKQSPFWRNDIVDAWCLSENTARNAADFTYCTYSEYWIGFYDKGARAYPGRIRLDCFAHGGMASYNFTSFFNPREIENEDDLEIQEKLLARINWLIDEGIIAINQ